MTDAMFSTKTFLSLSTILQQTACGKNKLFTSQTGARFFLYTSATGEILKRDFHFAVEWKSKLLTLLIIYFIFLYVLTTFRISNCFHHESLHTLLINTVVRYILEKTALISKTT